MDLSSCSNSTGVHHLEKGYWLKFERSGQGSRFKRRNASTDHWHRTEKDFGRPYDFKDAETLLDDFFDEVERVLRGRGVGLRVTRTEASRRQK